jgi:hypothetical protein
LQEIRAVDRSRAYANANFPARRLRIRALDQREDVGATGLRDRDGAHLCEVYHWLMYRFALVALVVAACGANDKPLLANAPKPDPGAVAGIAAAAAAAATLANPNAPAPESYQQKEKKPIKVKEHVPADVFDRLDNAQPAAASQPAAEPGAEKEKPAPVDYGLLKGPLTKSQPAQSKPVSDRPVAPLPQEPLEQH